MPEEVLADALKDRRDRLERQREALVNKDLEKMLEKVLGDLSRKKIVDLHNDEVLMRVLSVFGTPINHMSIGVPDWNRIEKKDLEVAKVDLWVFVLEQLDGRLRQASVSLGIGGSSAKHPKEEHTRIAQFMGFDIEELRDKAAKAKPEPKSWASLNADGTPKKRKMSPAKKKRTRYSDEKKAELLAKYHELVGGGMPSVKAVREVGVPYVTLRTWERKGATP